MTEHCYRIVVSGRLGSICREAFADFTIKPNGTTTVLVANLDQSALYGALNRVQSLGLELIELVRLNGDRSHDMPAPAEAPHHSTIRRGSSQHLVVDGGRPLLDVDQLETEGADEV